MRSKSLLLSKFSFIYTPSLEKKDLLNYFLGHDFNSGSDNVLVRALVYKGSLRLDVSGVGPERHRSSG